MPDRLRSLLGRINRVVHSIRFRITLWTIGILAIVLVAFSSFIFYSRENDVRDQTLQRLDTRSRQMAVIYQVAIRETAEHGNADLSAINTLGNEIVQEGDTLVLIGPDGAAAQSFGQINMALALQITKNWEAAKVSPGKGWYTTVRNAPWFNITEAGRIYLVRSVPGPFNRPGYLLILGGPGDPSQQLPRQVWTLILGSLGILAIASVGGYWLAGKLMAPVEEITHTAQEISATDLSRRINLEHPGRAR